VLAPRGLLVDFDGALTTDIFASFEAFCRAGGLERNASVVLVDHLLGASL